MSASHRNNVKSISVDTKTTTRAHDTSIPTSWCLDKLGLSHPLSTPSMLLFRFLLLSLIAGDTWLTLARANYLYGYGYTDNANTTGILLNVPHLPSSWPGVDTTCSLATRYHPHVLIACVYLLLHSALGLAGVWERILLSALFTTQWICHQQNDYQHVYLSVLIVMLFCFVPRELEYPRQKPMETYGRGSACWPFNAVLAQVSIVYIWTAIAKLDDRWFDGSTLHKVSGPAFRVQVGWLASLAGITDMTMFALLSKTTIVVELTLALALHCRRHRVLRLVTVCLGVGTHLSMANAGLDIGLFSYIMCAVYTLVLPDAIAATVMNRVSAVYTRVVSLLTAAIVTCALPLSRGTARAVLSVVAAFTYVGLRTLLIQRYLPLYPLSPWQQMILEHSVTTLIVATLFLGEITRGTLAAILPPSASLSPSLSVSSCTDRWTRRCLVMALFALLVSQTSMVREFHVNAVRNDLHFKNGGGKPDFARIHQRLSTALQIDPTHADTWAERGLYLDALATTQAQHQASRDYMKAVSLHPLNLKGLSGLIGYYLQHVRLCDTCEPGPRHAQVRPRHPVCRHGRRLCREAKRVLHDTVCDDKACEYTKRFAKYAQTVCQRFQHTLPNCVVSKQ